MFKKYINCFVDRMLINIYCILVTISITNAEFFYQKVRCFDILNCSIYILFICVCVYIFVCISIVIYCISACINIILKSMLNLAILNDTFMSISFQRDIRNFVLASSESDEYHNVVSIFFLTEYIILNQRHIWYHMARQENFEIKMILPFLLRKNESYYEIKIQKVNAYK